MRLDNEFYRFYAPVAPTINQWFDDSDLEALMMKSFEAGLRLGISASHDSKLYEEVNEELLTLDVGTRLDRSEDV